MSHSAKIPDEISTTGLIGPSPLSGSASASNLEHEARLAQFSDSTFVELLTSIVCSRTGAGVVFVRERYGVNTLWAHYFAPGANPEIMRSTQLTGNHEIIRAIHDFESRQI
jgi:hypothetical protein